MVSRRRARRFALHPLTDASTRRGGSYPHRPVEKRREQRARDRPDRRALTFAWRLGRFCWRNPPARSSQVRIPVPEREAPSSTRRRDTRSSAVDRLHRRAQPLAHLVRTTQNARGFLESMPGIDVEASLEALHRPQGSLRLRDRLRGRGGPALVRLASAPGAPRHSSRSVTARCAPGATSGRSRIPR